MMKLPTPDTVSGDLPGQVRKIGNYLIRLVRALEVNLEEIRKTAKDRGLSLAEIIDGVVASEKVLDVVYNYCEKRRAREAAKAAQEATDEVS